MKTRRIKQLVFTIMVMTMLLPMKAWPASLKIEPFIIKAGETKTMLIDVENADMPVTMVEFYMRLPEGLTIAKDEEDELAVDIAGRTTWKKHTLDAVLTGNSLHVLLYSAKNATLADNSGAVISITLTASETFTSGDVILEKQLLTAPDETESKPDSLTYTITDGSVPLDPEDLRADLNGDGKVDVADVVEVLKIIAKQWQPKTTPAL
jgi:hypothetical protein